MWLVKSILLARQLDAFKQVGWLEASIVSFILKKMGMAKTHAKACSFFPFVPFWHLLNYVFCVTEQMCVLSMQSRHMMVDPLPVLGRKGNSQAVVRLIAMHPVVGNVRTIGITCICLEKQ